MNASHRCRQWTVGSAAPAKILIVTSGGKLGFNGIGGLKQMK
jgi:hypothetical protein